MKRVLSVTVTIFAWTSLALVVVLWLVGVSRAGW